MSNSPRNMGTPGLPMVYRPEKMDTTFSDELAAHLCRRYTEECVESLVEHMRDRSNPTTSLVATNAILDRGYGKPKEIKAAQTADDAPKYKVSIRFIEAEDGRPKFKSPDKQPSSDEPVTIDQDME